MNIYFLTNPVIWYNKMMFLQEYVGDALQAYNMELIWK